MKKFTGMFLILMLVVSTSVFAGVKEKVLAPVNAVGEYIGKVVKGTNNSMHGFVSATAELGEDTYRGVTDQPASE